jgi:hypothetical protein
MPGSPAYKSSNGAPLLGPGGSPAWADDCNCCGCPGTPCTHCSADTPATVTVTFDANLEICDNCLNRTVEGIRVNAVDLAGMTYVLEQNTDCSWMIVIPDGCDVDFFNGDTDCSDAATDNETRLVISLELTATKLILRAYPEMRSGYDFFNGEIAYSGDCDFNEVIDNGLTDEATDCDDIAGLGLSINGSATITPCGENEEVDIMAGVGLIFGVL